MSLGRCSWSEVNKGEGKRLTTLSQVPHKPNFDTYCLTLPKGGTREPGGNAQVP